MTVPRRSRDVHALPPESGQVPSMIFHRSPTRTCFAVAGTAVTLVLASACGADTEAPSAAAPPASQQPADDGAAGTPTTTDPTDAEVPGPVVLDQLDGGQTRLSLEQGFLDALSALRVDVSAVAPATREGTTFTFPVTGGQATVDPAATDPFTGSVQHEGGLELSALGRSVTFDDLVVEASSGQVTAEANGQRVPLLALDDAQAKVARQAGELVVSDEAAALRPEALQTLTENLGLPPLPQTSLGRLEVSLPEQ